MTEEQYAEFFHIWNIIFSTLWPKEEPDMMVYRIENLPEDPNIKIFASLYTGSVPLAHTLVGEPLIKIVSREVISDLLEEKFNIVSDLMVAA